MVVEYHSGPRIQLGSGNLEHGLSHLDQRRRISTADRQPEDLHAAVECYVLPILEKGEQEAVLSDAGSQFKTIRYQYDRLPYSVTKAAVIALTEELALYLRPRGMGDDLVLRGIDGISVESLVAWIASPVISASNSTAIPGRCGRRSSSGDRSLAGCRASVGAIHNNKHLVSPKTETYGVRISSSSCSAKAKVLWEQDGQGRVPTAGS